MSSTLATTTSGGALDDNARSAERHDRAERPERRRHRVYVTRHLEYHTRDGVCVAVRDRKAGSWLRGHLAVDRPIVDDPGACPSSPVGRSLCFADARLRLVSPVVESVERPAKAVVLGYPAR